MADVSVFLEAVRAGDEARVRGLLREDGSLANAKSEQGFSPLVLAAYRGHHAVLKAILEARPSLDTHEAAIVGDVTRLRELLSESPALLEAYSRDGFTPIGLAAYFGQRAAAEFLLARGADVNAIGRNEARYTALTGAVAAGHTDVAKLLLDHGAEADYRYEGGHSPLLEAAAQGNRELVEALLARGADPNARTDDGKTPLSFATERNHADVAEILRRHGAKA